MAAHDDAHEPAAHEPGAREPAALERDAPPAGARRGPPVALILALLLAVALGGYAWNARGRVAALEQALATATAERDAALTAAGEAQAALGGLQGEHATLDARRLALEEELAQNRAELAQDRAELARLQAAAAATPPAAGAAPATLTDLQELAEGAGPAPAPEPAAAPTPLVTATAPAPVPPPPPAASTPETLTITFDVNSSYFPASLDGRLRQLAARLQPGQAYAVTLTGSVGTDPVANGAPGAAAAYNRWIAERRMTRVADFLQDNSDTLSLAIEQSFAAADPSRRVVVEVRPAQP